MHLDFLLPDYLDQDSFPTPAVELAVKDLLPGAKLETALGHCNHHLAAHDLPFQVSVGIVLAGAIVLILAGRRVGRQSLQPLLIVGKETSLVVVYQINSVVRHRSSCQ